MNYCETQKINVFEYVPLTFVLDYDKPNFFDEMQKFESIFEVFKTAKEKVDPISFVNTELDKIKVDQVDKKL